MPHICKFLPTFNFFQNLFRIQSKTLTLADSDEFKPTISNYSLPSFLLKKNFLLYGRREVFLKTAFK